jgi:hypothetical protein
MAMTRGPFAKRQKELARREKQKEKLARRLEAKERTGDDAAVADGEDPDIAGIRLGPQPPADDLTSEAGADGGSDSDDDADKD